ncbi:hypothetical protein [Leisingera sp. M523]|uniref:hypothetical protein n=1 Tax=Leisingera sp. M523 TaxID=2867013 RepID=UPI0021A3B21C|nr:hypothetical protein [Leisingera sp. M523]UWQ30209.1 hypothetical protein K3557_06645 [Leisingera sp. M523]
MSDDSRYERAGGGAFPFTEQGPGGETSIADPGMTLRDWFAGQAMAGLSTLATDFPASELANDAYLFADAMLKERSK